MNNIIKFTIGDYSGDGHDKREGFYFTSNLNSDQILEINKKCILKGADIVNQCKDYGEERFSGGFVAVVKDLYNLDFSKYAGNYYEHSKEWMTPKDYMECWIKILKAEDPFLHIEEIEAQDFKIKPGYGLFE